MESQRRSSTPVKCFLLSFFSFCIPFLFSAASVSYSKKQPLHFSNPVITLPGNDLYQSLSLDSLGLSKEAFEEAVKGYKNLEKAGSIQHIGILSIIDFSLPSFKKRLFVIDINQGKLLFNTLVAHGRNSGKILATRFSNRARSYASSLGFYITGDSYFGHKGYSLRLMGMEKGINDNAFNRGIVVHAATYVSEDRALGLGHVGRSEGCPAIPTGIHRAVIEAIKNGSCFFIYGQDKIYSSRSKLLHTQEA